jgi:hypothetical protein
MNPTSDSLIVTGRCFETFPKVIDSLASIYTYFSHRQCLLMATADPGHCRSLVLWSKTPLVEEESMVVIALLPIHGDGE